MTLPLWIVVMGPKSLLDIPNSVSRGYYPVFATVKTDGGM